MLLVQGEIEEPFQDPPTYTLYMTVRLLPTSGYLIYYWTSPTAIISTYVGEGYELDAPDWVSLITGTHTFWQPRSHMVDVLANLSTMSENEHLSTRILAWCLAVSVCLSYLLFPLEFYIMLISSGPH